MDQQAFVQRPEHLAFLAQLSGLLAASLDDELTLSRAVRLMVPTFADYCALHLLGEDGVFRRTHLAHINPEKEQRIRALEGAYPLSGATVPGFALLIERAEPLLVPVISPEMLDSHAVDEEHRGLMQVIAPRSALAVPLRARGHVIGMLVFNMSDSGRLYGEGDLGLASEVAQRTALAVNNAQLYKAAHDELVERRRVEAELRSSRDQLEIILQGVGDGITVQDTRGTLIYANLAAAQLLGFESVEALLATPTHAILGKYELLDEDGRPFPPEKVPSRLAREGVRDAAGTVRFREITTGEERWSMLRSTPVFDEQGQVQLVINIWHDISERQRIERELRESNQLLQAIIASSPLAIMVFDPDGTVRLWSPAAERMYGWSAEDVLGRFLPAIPDEERERFLGNLAAVIGGRQFVGAEARRLKHDGPFHAAIWTAGLRDAHGEVRQVMSIVDDITERKRIDAERTELLEREQAARIAAEEALRIRDAFLSIAAHEIKTPISALLGYSALIQRRLSVGQQIDERTLRAINTMGLQVNRLHRLSLGLLDLSRIQLGQLSIELAPLDLIALVRQIGDELQMTLERHTLVYQFEAPECVVQGDDLRLEQVVYNLLQNAIKYSPDGGEVRVQISCGNGLALLSITDHGIGIPSEDLPSLFSRFFRAGNVDAATISGMGLGLYIVREIVSRHGGQIHVASQLGQGSSFTVLLPLADTTM